MNDVQRAIQALKDMQAVAPEEAKVVALRTFKAIVKQEEVQRASQALNDMKVAAPEKAKAIALQTFEAIVKEQEAQRFIQALNDLEVAAPEKTKPISVRNFEAIMEQEEARMEVQRAIQALKVLEVAVPEKAKALASRVFEEAIMKQEEAEDEKRMDEEDRHLLEAIRASLEEKNIVARGGDVGEIALQTFEAIKEQEENEWEEAPTKKKRLFATPEKLLERGDKHNHEGNWQAFAEKMWRAVIWSVKRCFLAHNVLLSSRKSYDVFVKWLFEKIRTRRIMLNDQAKIFCLYDGWLHAELVYFVACGQNMGLSGLDEWRKSIGEFVEILSRISIDDGDLAELIGELKKNAPDTGKVVVEEVAKTPFQFCGVLFNYEYKCH